MTFARSRFETRFWLLCTVAALGVAAGAAGAAADVMQGARPPMARELEPQDVRARDAQYVRVAGLFGESDEEKAARLQKEQDQDTQIQQLNQRVTDLEQTVQRLTGEQEENAHRIQELNDRLQRQKNDFDYKLCTLSAQQLGAGTNGGDTGLPCGSADSASSAPQQQSDNQPSSGSGPGPQRLAPPPSVLGQIPSDTPLPLPPPDNGAQNGGGEQASTAPAANPNRPQFDAAMKLLSQSRYDEARAAFRSYADSYPKDELSPAAVYWVGDIAFVQKDYPNAARAFAEQIKKYGSSPRAPASMLKLGQSLIAMNQKEEGCTTLAALPSKYPQASQTILAQAKTERKAAHCR